RCRRARGGYLCVGSAARAGTRRPESARARSADHDQLPDTQSTRRPAHRAQQFVLLPRRELHAAVRTRCLTPAWWSAAQSSPARSPAAQLSAAIEGVGVLGPGLRDWPTATAVLAGSTDYQPARTELPLPTLLPAAERRRAGRVVRLALAVGAEAVGQTA